MKKNILLTLQISAVFIGTIVGAGLASGQEITQFFTTYGYRSFLGILICCLLYIGVSTIIIDISIRYNLTSYSDLISLVSPGFLGKITDLLTSLFLISSAAIILAGSGALLHQYLGLSKWFGIFIMVFASLIALLRDTKGLMEINSIIVPSLTIVILTIFFLYIIFYKDVMNYSYIKNIPYEKNTWFFSCLLYSGFNILCCSGVLVPLSTEIGERKTLFLGVIFGAIGLTILTFIINLLLMLNIPYIFQYDIPLLYITNRFGKVLQIMLLCIIWCEMFSTEVSDIYSVGKTVEKKFHIPYKKAVLLVLILAIPISQIGFVTLIQILYPSFGLISFAFILQCIYFNHTHK